jgi:hypothetical protein
MLRGSGGGDPEGLRLFLDRETPASSRGRLTLRSARVLRAVDMSVLSLSNGLSGVPLANVPIARLEATVPFTETAYKDCKWQNDHNI